MHYYNEQSYKIYLIYAEINDTIQWKIGITKDINKRIKQLQTGNPNIVDVVSFYEINNRELAYKVEADIKRVLKKYKIQGEWYLYESLDNDIFLQQCIKSENNMRILQDITNNIKETLIKNKT